MWKKIRQWLIALWPRKRRSPQLILHWHGYRAALDERGGTEGKPVAVEKLQQARVTHVVVPQHHGEYVQERLSRFRIIRNIERPWNPGLFRRDLGDILLQWKSADQPGPFLQALIDNLKAPCHGIAWNLEHDIMNPNNYPLTLSDMRLAPQLKIKDLAKQESYVTFRCLQFAILLRLIFHIAKQRHPTCQIAVAYSAYEGVLSRGLPLDQAYGVRWRLLREPLTYNGLALPPLSYAMCAYPHGKLPDETHAGGLPILHAITTHPSTSKKNRSKVFRLVIRDRLNRLRKTDGLGMVHAEMKPYWTAADSQACQIMGEEVGTLQG